MNGATLRVRDEPFFITGRGLVVVCEHVEGALYIGPHEATVEIPDGAGGARVETVSAVEAALGLDWKDRPALLFRVERGEGETALRALLQPGTLLALTGSATEVPPHTMSPAEFRRRLRAIHRQGLISLARQLWILPAGALLFYGPGWLGFADSARGDPKPLLRTGLCPRCGKQVLDAIEPRYA